MRRTGTCETDTGRPVHGCIPVNSSTAWVSATESPKAAERARAALVATLGTFKGRVTALSSTVSFLTAACVLLAVCGCVACVAMWRQLGQHKTAQAQVTKVLTTTMMTESFAGDATKGSQRTGAAHSKGDHTLMLASVMADPRCREEGVTQKGQMQKTGPHSMYKASPQAYMHMHMRHAHIMV